MIGREDRRIEPFSGGAFIGLFLALIIAARHSKFRVRALSGSLTLTSLAALWGMSDLTGIKRIVIIPVKLSS
jgi:hypothetical protein